MTKEQIYQGIVAGILDVLDGLSEEDIQLASDLKTLGANSLDRAEIIEELLDQWGLDIPMLAFAETRTVQDLQDVFWEHSKSLQA